MNEYVTKKNKASATPPQATQASSPLLNQSSLTSETSGSVAAIQTYRRNQEGFNQKQFVVA
jgi:hypothetical protein